MQKNTIQDFYEKIYPEYLSDISGKFEGYERNKVLNKIYQQGYGKRLLDIGAGWIVNRLYYLLMGVPRRTEGRKIPIWEWQHIRYFNKAEIRRF